MNRITYEMLESHGTAVQTVFRLLYPHGLTMEELEQKSKEFNWLRIIYEKFKEES